MTAKDLQTTIKDEKVKTTDEIKIKVSIQQPDGTWVKEIVPIDTYNITKTGEFQLCCCVWHPDADND